LRVLAIAYIAPLTCVRCALCCVVFPPLLALSPQNSDDVFDDISEELRQISEEGYERQSHDDDSDFVRKTDFFSRHRGIYDDDNNNNNNDDDDELYVMVLAAKTALSSLRVLLTLLRSFWFIGRAHDVVLHILEPCQDLLLLVFATH